MRLIASGQMQKMRVEHTAPVSYQLPLGDQLIPMAELIGSEVILRHEGEISCVHCGRLTKKSFNQGYCYPCFTKLAQCDSCIMSPEKCHFHLGTCREPEWGQEHCMRDHVVYLANSSGVKVGITRDTQVPTRWIDQGAIAAMPVARVQSRHISGLVETVVKAHVSDRTNWQAMLKGPAVELDLVAKWRELLALVGPDIEQIQQQYGLQAVDMSAPGRLYEFSYPVQEYPVKVRSLNLDKTPEVGGVLQGIKGQYLIFDTGVMNIRKYGAYHISLFA